MIFRKRCKRRLDNLSFYKDFHNGFLHFAVKKKVVQTHQKVQGANVYELWGMQKKRANMYALILTAIRINLTLLESDCSNLSHRI